MPTRRDAEAAEDAADVRAYDAIKARIARGEEEIFPAEVVNRIIDGENKIRVLREYRGKSVKQLAQDAGIAAPYLSQIEAGTRDATADIYGKLAAALRVDVDELTSLEPPSGSGDAAG